MSKFIFFTEVEHTRISNGKNDDNEGSIISECSKSTSEMMKLILMLIYPRLGL